MRKIALVNQKGGVGKTTTAVNLSAAIAKLDRRVLLVDLDPQSNATVSLGVPPHQQQNTSYALLNGASFDPVKLSDHKGKVALISFWATWCPPCRQQLPHEREMVTGKYKDRPFVLSTPRLPEPGLMFVDRPFAHPRYWAAFVLIGDPD